MAGRFERPDEPTELRVLVGIGRGSVRRLSSHDLSGDRDRPAEDDFPDPAKVAAKMQALHFLDGLVANPSGALFQRAVADETRARITRVFD